MDAPWPPSYKKACQLPTPKELLPPYEPTEKIFSLRQDHGNPVKTFSPKHTPSFRERPYIRDKSENYLYVVFLLELINPVVSYFIFGLNLSNFWKLPWNFGLTRIFYINDVVCVVNGGLSIFMSFLVCCLGCLFENWQIIRKYMILSVRKIKTTQRCIRF